MHGMIFKTAHVRKYKCVKDSTQFKIDRNATCLVGKNESGKTALLHALEKINPVKDQQGVFDDLEYPRAEMSEYRERQGGEPIHVVSTVWELDDEDVAAVATVVGEGVLSSTTITIEKGYYAERRWTIDVDEAKGFANLIESADLHEEERAPLRDAGSIDAAKGILEEKKATGDEEPGDVRSQREQALLDRINETFPELKCRKTIEKLLEKRLPRMVYFGEYFRMPGQVSLEDLNSRAKAKNEPPNRVFLALLDMIGRDADALRQIDEFERLQAELEAASQRLTREIFRYWSQNTNLRVQFRFEQGMPGDPAPFNTGYVMRTRIENLRHGVTTSFDDRSSGFVWFFSFLVYFSQVKKNFGDRLIILLDEPGLSLHAKAQGDLLRYIDDRLASQYQVIYTTHSPFMIDPSNLLRVRTVEDIYIQAEDPSEEDQDLGTVVGDEVLSTDRDTLFPLQAALGYEITQSLFIGEHSLLVEGPSELLYLPWFSRKLQSLGRTSLDDRWTLTPCGGIDKIPAFLSLFAGQKLHIATLVDFAEGSKKKVRDLRGSDLLRSGHVFSAEHYAGQSEADVEDLLGREAYVHLVNDCYALHPSSELPTTKPTGAPERVVKEVEEHFRTVATTGSEFDHYRPAEFLNQKGLDYALRGIDRALDRFEELFSDVNGLL
jgi:predicted ATPase